MIYANALPQQFLVYAVQALDATLNLGGDASLFQLVAQHLLHLSQKLLACLAPRFDRFLHLLVADGIHIAEAQIFQFAANLAHAEAMSDGSVDVQCLFGYLLLALRRQVLQRAHIV